MARTAGVAVRPRKRISDIFRGGVGARDTGFRKDSGGVWKVHKRADEAPLNAPEVSAMAVNGWCEYEDFEWLVNACEATRVSPWCEHEDFEWCVGPPATRYKLGNRCLETLLIHSADIYPTRYH